ncbi:uncharacterized protein [Epargyreus clarus]|uniref:uncharacterized protein n=1 Tax=Epargyreus clarus TaxID=520877 RepID=UPI003C2BF015
MNLEFTALVDEEQLNANSDYDIRMFTDGSKIEGQVGAALSIWNGEAEVRALKLALPSYCTVYQAELLAIWKASEVAKNRKETSFAIYSDSMSALQSLTAKNCTHPLANKVVALFWIKAHAGLPGNERADQLAKEAALNARVAPSYVLCPVSFVKRCLRQRSIDEWNGRYRSGTTAGVTKIFLPDAAKAYRVVRKMEITGVRTQIITGHGGFSEYLNRFRCKESPSCTCEPGELESVPHILSDCPAHGPHILTPKEKFLDGDFRRN